MRLTIDLSRSRVETKYGVAAHEVPALIDRIAADELEEYAVLTLYFDRPDGSLARRAMADPLHCIKVRAREYPDDPSVWFEVKRRQGSWTRKSRLKLTRPDAARLLRGLSPGEADAFAPLRGGDDDGAEARSRLRDLARGELRPVGTVTSFRKTFLLRQAQVRITLDQEIAYYGPCENPYQAPGSTASGLLLRREPELVLEVKHAGVLPPWCRELVSGLRRSRYSKFRNLVRWVEESRKAAG